ncbi:MAG: hypothetical protein LBI84_01605 [Propionibacteriaceae bacterium]|nr:hypothetical protein [Propionibacteriaceae bacterium]
MICGILLSSYRRQTRGVKIKFFARNGTSAIVVVLFLALIGAVVWTQIKLEDSVWRFILGGAFFVVGPAVSLADWFWGPTAKAEKDAMNP